MKVFGAGCIYFGYLGLDPDTSLPPHVKNTKVFFDDLKRRLEGVENVSNLAIEDHSSADGTYMSLDSNGKSVIIPFPHGAHLQFDLYIPFRIQDSFYRRCDVELVHIDMVWAYEMPITFVSYDWPEEEGGANPSSAVIAVRKYLEKKLCDGMFVCECVGPSPFHGDFSIIETDLDDGFKLIDVSTDRLGYATLEILAPPNSKLLDAVYGSHLEHTLSQFYHLSERRVKAIREQTSIVANSRNLLEKGAPNGLKAMFERLRGRPKEIDALNKHVFQEMLVRLDISTGLSEAERHKIIGSDIAIDRFFDEFREMAIEESWGKFAEVAKFFEERHQKSIGNLTAVFAGIIGGVVGSLIGALATYTLTTTTSTSPPPSPAPSSAPATVPDTAR